MVDSKENYKFGPGVKGLMNYLAAFTARKEFLSK